MFFGQAKHFKGHFTKVYSIKEGELRNFPGILPIEVSCLHTVDSNQRLEKRFFTFLKFLEINIKYL